MMYKRGMSRVVLWSFTIASVLFWGLALLMALLEVAHLAHGQSDYAAGTFAMQALVLAAVFTLGALAAARSGEAA